MALVDILREKSKWRRYAELTFTGGGGGTPGGVDTEVQFNNAGAFDGFGSWDGTTFALDTLERININSQAADVVTLSGVSGSLIVGNTAGNQIAFDRTGIQRKQNATTAGTLDINRLGGDVVFGNAIALTGFDVNAPNSGFRGNVNVGVLSAAADQDVTINSGQNTHIFLQQSNVTRATIEYLISDSTLHIDNNNTGDVALGNFVFDTDQAVGAGQDNFVLTYDDGTGLISLEAAAGGSIGGSIADNQIAVGAATANEIEGSSAITFDSSATLFKLEGPIARFDANHNAAALDQGYWRTAYGDGTMNSRIFDDALTNFYEYFSLTRSGTGAGVQVDTIDFTAETDINLNSDVTIRDTASQSLLIISADDTFDSTIRFNENSIRRAEIANDASVNRLVIRKYDDATGTSEVSELFFDNNGDIVLQGQSTDIVRWDESLGEFSVRTGVGGTKNESLNISQTEMEYNALIPVFVINDSNNGTGGTSYLGEVQWRANDTEIGSIGYKDGTNDLIIQTEDFNSSNIVFKTAGGNTRGSFNSAGTQFSAGNFVFNIDQAVGSGQDNYVLTYDDASGEISLEAAGAGVADGTMQIATARDLTTNNGVTEFLVTEEMAEIKIDFEWQDFTNARLRMRFGGFSYDPFREIYNIASGGGTTVDYLEVTTGNLRYSGHVTLRRLDPTIGLWTIEGVTDRISASSSTIRSRGTIQFLDGLQRIELYNDLATDADLGTAQFNWHESDTASFVSTESFRSYKLLVAGVQLPTTKQNYASTEFTALAGHSYRVSLWVGFDYNSVQYRLDYNFTNVGEWAYTVNRINEPLTFNGKLRGYSGQADVQQTLTASDDPMWFRFDLFLRNTGATQTFAFQPYSTLIGVPDPGIMKVTAGFMVIDDLGAY